MAKQRANKGYRRRRKKVVEQVYWAKITKGENSDAGDLEMDSFPVLDEEVRNEGFESTLARVRAFNRKNQNFTGIYPSDR